MHFPQINEQYAADVLDLLAVGATLEEAIEQVAIQNEVEVAEVEAQ